MSSIIISCPKMSIHKANSVINNKLSIYIDTQKHNPCKMNSQAPQIRLISDPFNIENGNRFGFKQTEEMVVVVEGVDLVIQRLEKIVGKMIEVEMEKLMGRIKGEISVEKKQEVDMMSREIVNKFFEKPIQYLRHGQGKLEDKLKDFNVLLGMLESSILSRKQKATNKTMRHSCPRSSRGC